MPLPSLHPSLPQNPTVIGSGPSSSASPSASFGRAVGSSSLAMAGASPAGGGGSVNRETLKGLQDVEWSDDEDDPDCMVCAEPLDLSDQNFKPCPCGLGICQFCYNRLLREDPRCPGCRRRYDRENVVFEPVDFEAVKKAKDRKAKRAKTIKQLTSMGRRHLLGTRVVMKNTVYVTGMQLPASTPEESVSILRTHEYFGQYGKVAKIYIRDRSSATYDDPSSAHGIYIVYTRREDAARAISAINSMPSPTSPSASYGTTRYCDAFLRGMKCDNSGCTNLHEWGGESDCFSKDDYEVALTRPAEYDARQKQAAAVAPPSLTIKSHWPKPNAEDAGSSALPNSAGWGKNISVKTVPANKAGGGVNGTKSLKIGNMVSLKSASAFPPPSPSPSPSVLPIGSARSDKKSSGSKATPMARGKSSDSTQSTQPPTSAQPSPRKKPISLTSSTTIPTVTPSSSASASASTATPVTAPPPGLGIAPPPGLSKPAPPAPTPAHASAPVPIPVETGDDSMPEESTSADSEAGPSSTSPTPQTPAQSTDTPLPAPLTSDPIFLHSPYEDPEIYNFPPTTDPDFEFVLAHEVEQAQHGMTPFTPAPFSKTLVGLAELGVLSPDLPNLATPSRSHRTFSTNFQPFDLSAAMLQDDGDAPVAGPSRSRDTQARHQRADDEMIEAEPPRTTSRFDFARQSTHTPHSYSRGQSPFAMRTASGAGGAAGDWGAGPGLTRQQQQQQMFEEHMAAARLQQQQHTGDSRSPAPSTHTNAGALASFVGSYGSEWSQGLGQGSTQDLGSPARLDGRMSQLSMGRQHQGRNDENGAGAGYTDPVIAQYGPGPGPGPQRLFSPESSIHEEYHPHPSHSQQQQHQQQQSQYTPLHQNFYQQHQQQQARTHSPTPVSINPHSFRRY